MILGRTLVLMGRRLDGHLSRRTADGKIVYFGLRAPHRDSDRTGHFIRDVCIRGGD